VDSHTRLQISVYSTLKSLGFQEVEIEHKIYPEDSMPIVVDVVGISPNGETVAVECGAIQNMPRRLLVLANRYDTLYWAPVMPLLFKLDRRDLDKCQGSYGLEHTCAKCGYHWIPRVQHPKRCPRCQSVYWCSRKGEVVRRKGRFLQRKLTSEPRNTPGSKIPRKTRSDKGTKKPNSPTNRVVQELQRGKTPQELIKSGYARSTVHLGTKLLER